MRRHGTTLAIALAAFALDQATKWWVVQELALGQSWPRHGFFRITHVANTGSVFGLFSGANLALTVASFIGIGALLVFYRSHDRPTLMVRASLGLMLAGAVGNLLDRVRLGHVTDFIDVGPWYIFNMADACIMVGVILLAAAMLLAPAEQSEPALSAATIPGDEERYD